MPPRRRSRSRFAAGARISRGAFLLFFLETGLSLVFIFVNEARQADMAHWLVASADSVWREGRVWTLVTSSFLQPSFVSVIFHALMLWLFVPTLERWWGTRRLLVFAAATSIAGTVAGTLLGLLIGSGAPVYGLDSFIYGGVVAFGVVFAAQPVQFFGVLPMSGRQFTYGIVAFVFLFVLLQKAWVMGGAFAAAMLLAWGMTSGRVTPGLWWRSWRQGRARGKLRAVRDDDERPKRWMN